MAHLSRDALEAEPGLPVPNPTDSTWHHPPDAFLKGHRTTPELPRDSDIVIIGSGISGTMTALYIYDHFMRAGGGMPNVIMLDSREACWGATGRNGGNCKPAYYAYAEFEAMCAELGVSETIKIIDFQVKNLELLREIVRQNDIHCDFTPTTAIDAFFSSSSFHTAQRCISRLRQSSSRLASAIETHLADSPSFSSYRCPTAKGIVTYPCATLWPYKLISHILTKLITDCGLNLQTNTSAMDIKQLPPGSMSSTTARVPRRWIVKTDRGIISATDVIVATNAWTSNLLPDFKGKIVPVKGHCSALSPPQTLKDKRLPGAYAIVRKDRRRAEYLIQRPNGDIVVGGGRWLQNNQGVGQADDSTVEEDVVRYLRSVPGKSFTGESGWTTSNSATSRSNDKSPSEPDWTHVSLPPSSPKPQSDPPHLLGPKQEWTGIMGFSSDGRPWVGPLPGSPGLWIIAGMEGHGMAYATGCAAALVDMLVHTPSPPPPLSLSSSFHRGRRNWDVETSFYGIRQAKGMPSMNHTLWFPSSFLVTQERMERKGLGALAGFDQGMELDEWDRDVMSELGSIKQYELTTDESGVEVLENGLFEVDLNSEGSEEDWVVL